MDRDAVLPWHATPVRPAPRMALWSEAFRPAETTDAWRHERAELAAGTAGRRAGRSTRPCRRGRPHRLAAARALETPGKRATLVTTSRGLGRRVAAELLRWGVRVDDSAGVPLDQSPPGSFLLLTAQLATPDASPVQLLAALKHPLAAGGIERAEFRRRVRALERLALRGIRPAGGLHGLGGRAAGRRRAGGPPRLARRPSQQRRDRSTDLMAGEQGRLGGLLEAHLALTEWLAADADRGSRRAVVARGRPLRPRVHGGGRGL